MAKNHHDLFKFEFFKKGGINSYIIYRKNLFGKFKKVALGKIFPGKRAEVFFFKSITLSDEMFVRGYLDNLSQFKIEVDTNPSFYNVYKKNKKIAYFVNLSPGTELHCIDDRLSSFECMYLQNYFNTFHQN